MSQQRVKIEQLKRALARAESRANLAIEAAETGVRWIEALFGTCENAAATRQRLNVTDNDRARKEAVIARMRDQIAGIGAKQP